MLLPPPLISPGLWPPPPPRHLKIIFYAPIMFSSLANSTAALLNAVVIGGWAGGWVGLQRDKRWAVGSTHLQVPAGAGEALAAVPTPWQVGFQRCGAACRGGLWSCHPDSLLSLLPLLAGGVNVAATFVGLVLVDSVGRRPLLLEGGVQMTVSQARPLGSVV